MVATAVLAIGTTSLLAFRSPRDMQETGVGVLALVLALILTLATDRASFGERHRAFWLGFAAAGWLCAAMALSNRQETRQYLLSYGPPIVRAREQFQRQQHIAAHEERLRGVDLVTPEVSEIYLACSLFAELGIGLILGGLIASVGGLFCGCRGVPRATGERHVRSIPTHRGGCEHRSVNEDVTQPRTIREIHLCELREPASH